MCVTDRAREIARDLGRTRRLMRQRGVLARLASPARTGWPDAYGWPATLTGTLLPVVDPLPSWPP